MLFFNNFQIDIFINGNRINRVNNFKLLGYNLNNNQFKLKNGIVTGIIYKTKKFSVKKLTKFFLI